MLGRSWTARSAGPLLRRNKFSWATCDPATASADAPAEVSNLVAGKWVSAAATMTVTDPYNGQPFIKVPDTQSSELQPFVDSLRSVPKTGLHNPYKNPERYVMYGDICARVVEEMRKPEVEDFFARWVQRTSPKSYFQAAAEVKVTRLFFENYCGDQVRFLAKGFRVSGDHMGQTSNGLRYPYGPVGLITPFNFPLEIPALQLMGALFMGNKPLLHVDWKVCVVVEQFLRLLHHCGMPITDVDFLAGKGTAMGEVLNKVQPPNTLFTGSSKVAEILSKQLAGKVKLEDAGFDWKILGPDVAQPDYTAWQCDQDAYACSGQKCSATSILFMHENWVKAGLEAKLAERAAKRKLDDVTIGPVLTWTTDAMLGHVDKLLKIPGSRVAFGGKPLEGHTIPDCYGAIQPTAVYVPLDQILKEENFPTVTTEVFGPVQVITNYDDSQLDMVLEACERMQAHLTAAVVSNDIHFVQKVLGNTVNGTTYVGQRGRTTGAPQNHWFGPAGDPRSAGIGTPEAIRLVWSCHREVIEDFGPVPPEMELTTT